MSTKIHKKKIFERKRLHRNTKCADAFGQSGEKSSKNIWSIVLSDLKMSTKDNIDMKMPFIFVCYHW